MTQLSHLRLSGERFSVEYRLTGRETEARAMAESLCLDQTVELPKELVPPGSVGEQVLGRVEDFTPFASNAYLAVISFPADLAGADCAQLLGVVFGISSLKPGIRVMRLHLAEGMLKKWPGPRFGRDGLRLLTGVHDRPLVCGVLKPIGLSASALADLAYRFALGGLDLVKDDQGFSDQRFCPFEERVTRCAEAVAKANHETGRRCLYMAHVTGPSQVMRRRCFFAKEAGAGGVLICPGLVGFDAIRELASDDTCALPIVSHPNLLGSYIGGEAGGIAPRVLLGLLPRLAGADVSIYPSYDGGFLTTREDCRGIGSESQAPLGHLKPIFPTAAGRMDAAHVQEVSEFYSGQVVIIAGSSLIRQGQDAAAAARQFMEYLPRG